MKGGYVMNRNQADLLGKGRRRILYEVGRWLRMLTMEGNRGSFRIRKREF